MSEIIKRPDGGGADSAPTDSVDRIVLRRVENDRLHGWTAVLNARFDGMIRVTKSDLANFIVRQHAEALSESEIKAIETELFDEVRWLNWALAKIRQAKKAGQLLSLNDLMVKRDAIQGRKDVPTGDVKRRRRKSAQTDTAPNQSDGPNYTDLEEG